MLCATHAGAADPLDERDYNKTRFGRKTLTRYSRVRFTESRFIVASVVRSSIFLGEFKERTSVTRSY